MLDPEDEKVVSQVVTKLAGPPTPWHASKLSKRPGSLEWLDHEELLSEAYIAITTTDVRSGATSRGAFHERLKGKLLDSQDAEMVWRWERGTSIEFSDVDDRGNVYRVTQDEDGTPHSVWIADANSPVEDYKQPHVPGQRSRVLDALRSMSKEEFIAWADKQLGRAWGKKSDVRTLLFGTSTEQERLWIKYARGKRVRAGSRVKVDGNEPSADEHQQSCVEEWRARYRYESNSPHPLVVSADEHGAVIGVATVLRQPIR